MGVYQFDHFYFTTPFSFSGSVFRVCCFILGSKETVLNLHYDLIKPRCFIKVWSKAVGVWI